MKILILGGTGAMGVSLVEMLAERGDVVHVTSRGFHESNCANVWYFQGNAHEEFFLREVLKNEYDAIIDFMIYSVVEFESKVDMLLSATKQYFFISSSRVYADSKIPITEQSDRLIDVCQDKEYLSQEEYALVKAKEENVLFRLVEKKNWTVIRPYITYNDERLQLGIYEKEWWLYRALHGRTIVFTKDISNHITTLTYGVDVARGIMSLLGKEDALGEVFNIVGSQGITWNQVLAIYLKVLKRNLKNEPKVLYLENSADIEKILGNKYQIKYDRCFDRIFENRKINKEVEFIDIESGLDRCLQNFLEGPQSFQNISWRLEAYMDRMAGERTPLREIPTLKQKVKYLRWRYCPISIR